MGKGRGSNPYFAKYVKPKKNAYLASKEIGDKREDTADNEDTNKHDYNNARNAVSDAKDSMKKMNRIKTG